MVYHAMEEGNHNNPRYDFWEWQVCKSQCNSLWVWSKTIIIKNNCSQNEFSGLIQSMKNQWRLFLNYKKKKHDPELLHHRSIDTKKNLSWRKVTVFDNSQTINWN